MRKYLTVIAAIAFLSTAVNAQQDTKPVTDKVETEKPVEGPQMTLESTVVDYGEIENGSDPLRSVAFTNTGTEPLVISNAKGSCGCTVPDWPREPIPVGGEAVIKVQYDSRGKGKTRAEGGRAENKRVTITANTDPANTYLYIKGKVFKPEAAPAS